MTEYVMVFVVLIFSLVVHESAHAWMAFRKGDPTAYLAGRLTLNPIAHLDPIGSVVLPLVMIISGAPVIGWAKPVPVNPARLRHPAEDHFWVSLAGPASNLLLGAGFTVLYGITVGIFNGSILGRSLAVFSQFGIYINFLLAFFNLIPIPPLDGSWVFGHLFPNTVGKLIDRIRPFGTLVLILLLFSGMFRWILYPAIALTNIMLRLATSIVL